MRAPRTSIRRYLPGAVLRVRLYGGREVEAFVKARMDNERRQATGADRPQASNGDVRLLSD